MNRTVSRLNELESLIISEIEKYTGAISHGKPLAELLIIYERIKELKQERLTLSEEVNSNSEKSQSE